ncbi:HNH endonuclease, partial [Terrabacter sp. MAHUQ-38]|nr:HNH endonuclease [Terrabacter sp. MAHUQ-38]
MPFLDTCRSPLEVVLEQAVGRTVGRGSVRREAARGDGEPGGLRDGSLDAASDRVLGQIEWLEVAKARLEGRLVDAYAALHTIEEQQLARL